ncbi:hypothetical protein AVDCRST_MAG84-5817, partial [uncultured Microcoleus sp.]
WGAGCLTPTPHKSFWRSLTQGPAVKKTPKRIKIPS